MSFAVQLRASIERAATIPALTKAVQALYRAASAGGVTDTEAEALDALAISRRAVLQPPPPVTGPAPLGSLTRSIFPPRRYQRSPNRPRSIARRRHLASSGPMPPALASRFTTGQLAVFKVIADEVRERRACTLTLGEIAARAGVCRSLAQEAIRQAERDCLLTVQRERPKGQRNKPNRVRILSREWFAWIMRGPGRGGFKKSAPTGSTSTQSLDEHAKRNRSRSFRRKTAEPSSTRSG